MPAESAHPRRVSCVAPDHPLARALVLDELFDLTLYQNLARHAEGGLQKMLGELVTVETRHLRFWQDFFDIPITTLDGGRKAKLAVIVAACRVFGPTSVHMVLEGIEVYGIRKYLSVWETYKDDPLGEAVRGILMDEFEHEDHIVSRMSDRKISPEKVRSIFLGFNDGLVEILGAVSGFFAAFSDAGTVVMAGLTVAVAGCLSMGAGAYVAASSEKEVEKIEAGKARFLGQTARVGNVGGAMTTAFVVGISYFLGAMVPVLPVLLGGHMAMALTAAAVLIVLVSMVLAFLSGMDIRKRILTNLVILSAAVAISYAIGTAVKAVWGVNI